MTTKRSGTDEVSIVLGGEAGQGIQTIELLLTKILKLNGYFIYATKEYMSRVRGGTNSTSIRVASVPVRAPVKRIDLLIPLDNKVIPHLKERLSQKTVIVGDENILDSEYKVHYVPFASTAKGLGNPLFANTIALGFILGLFETDALIMKEYLEKHFSSKGEEIIKKNIEAGEWGFQEGVKKREAGLVDFQVTGSPAAAEDILINGSEALGLGAIAGGCRCITSYPMTPGTGVMTFMARHLHDFDLLVEQAEDEIAAINMALGAWYAGARAMVTTSGGGFALMTEGISLAGMLEMPVVIHLAQRPGPATGLPTRTEQGDLDLALYAGHGEFPRIILAPESIEETFNLARKAFDLADKYQVPVIILTDQYLVDTYYNIKSSALHAGQIEKYIVNTGEDYCRYALTADGISPRGIPGKGEGLVGVDSDEHDEAGHITEDSELRVKMVDKRLRKLKLLQKDTHPLRCAGPRDAWVHVISWGSTNLIVKEAIKRLNARRLVQIAIQQVYPLPIELKESLNTAKKIIIVENNATSQMGRLILRETGRKPDNAVLKYNGLPFTVDELMAALKPFAN